MHPYCLSRVQTIRRKTREVYIGNVPVGGNHPIAVQSMTTTNTEDVEATVAQARELFENGCQIVRVTAPSMKAARALSEIRKKLVADGFSDPMVADIHFLPKAALEAVEHVEKVRINPGNFADYKKFKEKTYTDAAYQEEIDRIYDAFSPFVLRCKELGRSIRIGTNHGSLSDRIMNRYGDTPEGMVESALEFIRVAESHGFHDIVLSMKASNPKVMIAAYRLAVARMDAENMHYPLHLGVTEAGDGEDARVKSAMGIGSLLADGLGDTIRVSLTEDPIYEVPVARSLVQWAETQQKQFVDAHPISIEETLDFYAPARNEVEPVGYFGAQTTASDQAPIVAIGCPGPQDPATMIQKIAQTQARCKDACIEFFIVPVLDRDDLPKIDALSEHLQGAVKGLILDLADSTPELLEALSNRLAEGLEYLISVPFAWVTQTLPDLPENAKWCFDFKGINAIEPSELQPLPENSWITISSSHEGIHPIGSLRKLIGQLHSIGRKPPVWLRNRDALFAQTTGHFSERLLESTILAGSLLSDGVGNMISIESEVDLRKATALAYNILQAARVRITKTEFIACPSCGRTLFDLQSTTQKIRARTDHLKGVTIAIMGCIVNGPGEMADADFGYVGGAPGKVNLYVGKKCVQSGIPQAEAVDALIELIREHGKWVDPDPRSVDTQ